MQALGQAQRLQTVAVEASSALRNQCIHVLQAHTIRLEDMADTEIEDHEGMDQCMDELMLGVLYTELRKDIREAADALDMIQHEALSSRHATVDATTSRTPAEADNTQSTTAAAAQRSSEDAQIPPPLSATSETFRTARGAPMGLAEYFADASDEAPIDEEPSPTNGNQKQTVTLEDCEQKLYNACMEIDEWRRTPCITEFLASVQDKQMTQRSRSPSTSSPKSARLPVAQLVGEIRERHRMRAQSTGDAHGALAGGRSAALESSLRLNASPPLSRLMQVEHEVEDARRQSDARRTSSTGGSTSSNHQPATDTVMPCGEPQSIYTNTLHLTSSPASNSLSRRTIVDDVRIIGWVTRGSGLDVHTEFKVIVHLTSGENLTVMRRYTDFEILREVLCERYRTFSKRIPTLPRKKAFGKFEDRFLKKRENGLQFFLAYVMLHPVIGCSAVIRQWLQVSG
ncbi:hypothetical protein H4R20_001445 [Coemansia guatemalensis]|uniref:PX domain-containing protein n=1 Tax=Coemansia guatemalensis TaxID=2761395 RepID=A0A9W8HXE0_9FUNG|nr:hypothetical protein H4R20_001445 [Coemansia guatemalensis]